MKKTKHLQARFQGALGATVVALCLSGSAPAALLNDDTTRNDSTQPRGTPPGVNAAGQDLSPLIHGFLAPAHRAQFSEGGEALSAYFDWSGTIMGNAIRDPGFFSTLNVANKDFINYLNGLFRSTSASDQAAGAALLASLGLDDEVTFTPATGLQPEALLPMTGDFCLRCHSPGGWLEGQSEPPTSPDFTFLKGQLWGAAFTEYPGHNPTGPGAYKTGAPRQVDIFNESHTGMEGVSCDLCHRATDNFKRKSNHDPSVELPNGNGGFLVARQDPHRFRGIDASQPDERFLKSATLCGTCHDVTNPLLDTDNQITTVPNMPASMKQPIERTFTEWYWSAFRKEGVACQNCHAPMKFQGAQTWMLYPGLSTLWANVDEVWTQPPFNYAVPASREMAYFTSARRNQEFMRSAASMRILRTQRVGDTLRVTVRVINNTGHKLPTGFGEGRQMWIHFQAQQGNGPLLYENGALDGNGHFVGGKPGVRAHYEFHAVVSEHTKSLKKANGKSIVDSNDDGVVTEAEKDFHFVLFTEIKQDNRIPPRGWDRNAYFRDGAFVIPENRYAAGQNWDDTTYEIPLNGYRGKVNVTAALRYQTFSRDYIDFLVENDKEPTVKNGGRARKIPDGPLAANAHWSGVLEDIWTGAQNGKPVEMASVRKDVDAK
ncbi:MAG: hypothetical protein HZA90_28675 [Verrucomicrobia bacterium]|nr:hypothetical protein [Verrucomicrobiota bacterium]